MSFLAGFQAVQQASLNAQKIKGQRISNQAAQAQLSQYQSQEVMQVGNNLGYVRADNTFDRELWQSHIDSDDSTLRDKASFFGAALANRVHGNEQFLATDVKKLKDGTFVTTGQNLQTGKPGVITDNATTDPDDIVTRFGSQEAGNLMDLIYSTKIRPDGSDPLRQNQLALINDAEYISESQGRPDFVRNAYGALSRLPEEEREEAAGRINALIKGEEYVGPGATTTQTQDTSVSAPEASDAPAPTPVDRNATITRIEELRTNLVEEPVGRPGRGLTPNQQKVASKNKATNAQIDAAFEKLPEVIEIRKKIDALDIRTGGTKSAQYRREIEAIKNNPLVPDEINEAASSLPDDPEELKGTLQTNTPVRNQELISTIANYMRSNNVTDINQLSGQPLAVKKMAIAAAVANIPEGNLRNQTLVALTNLMETGNPGTSSLDVAKFGLNQKTFGLRYAELQRQFGNDTDAANKTVSEISTNIVKPLIDDDGTIKALDDLEDGQRAEILTTYSILTRNARGAQTNREANRAPTPIQLAAEKQLLDALIPLTIGRAREEGLSVLFEPLESLYSIGRDDPNYIPGSMADQIGIEKDRKGSVTRIFFGDPSGGRTEDSISVTDLLKVMDQADINTLIAIGEINQSQATQ